MNTTTLLNDLKKRTKTAIKDVQPLKNLSLEKLNWKSTPDSWSILECLEHLNLYGDFYLPEIEQRMLSSTLKSDDIFKSGFMGNYFAKSMLPKEPLNKMKTFKDKNPLNSDLDSTCIDRFLLQQEKMLELLDMAQDKNLNKINTAISISKWIKLKLGDTFRIVIYHNQRHLVQAQNVLNTGN